MQNVHPVIAQALAPFAPKPAPAFPQPQHVDLALALAQQATYDADPTIVRGLHAMARHTWLAYSASL